MSGVIFIDRVAPVYPTTLEDDDRVTVNDAAWKLLILIVYDEALSTLADEYSSICMLEIVRTLSGLLKFEIEPSR